MNEIKNSNVNIKDLENLRNKLNTKIKNSSLTKDTANFFFKFSRKIKC